MARLLDPSSLVPAGFVVDDVLTEENCLIVHAHSATQQGSSSYLAAIVVSTFSTRRYDASAPPTMMEGPWRAPSSPPA